MAIISREELVELKELLMKCKTEEQAYQAGFLISSEEYDRRVAAGEVFRHMLMIKTPEGTFRIHKVDYAKIPDKT